MYFHTLPKFQCHFLLLTHNIQTLFFCSNLVSIPKFLNTKVENFSLIFSSLGVPNKVFELLLNTYILTDVQIKTNAFLHLPFDPKYLLPQKQCNNEYK